MAPRRPEEKAPKKRNLSTYGAMVAQARAPKVAKSTETESKSSLPLNDTASASASEACPPTPIAAASTDTGASLTPGYTADATSKIIEPQPESADGEQTMSLPTAMLSDRYLTSTDQTDNEEEDEEVVIPADTLSRIENLEAAVQKLRSMRDVDSPDILPHLHIGLQPPLSSLPPSLPPAPPGFQFVPVAFTGPIPFARPDGMGEECFYEYLRSNTRYHMDGCRDPGCGGCGGSGSCDPFV